MAVSMVATTALQMENSTERLKVKKMVMKLDEQRIPQLGHMLVDLRAQP